MEASFTETLVAASSIGAKPGGALVALSMQALFSKQSVANRFKQALSMRALPMKVSELAAGEVSQASTGLKASTGCPSSEGLRRVAMFKASTGCPSSEGLRANAANLFP